MNDRMPAFTYEYTPLEGPEGWTPQGNLEKPLSYFDAINMFPKNCM